MNPRIEKSSRNSYLTIYQDVDGFKTKDFDLIENKYYFNDIAEMTEHKALGAWLNFRFSKNRGMK